MHILRRLRRGWERLGVLPSAIILAYHRVADLPVDPQSLAVSRAHFGEQLAVLRRDYHPLSLRDLRRGLRRQRWPRRSVVVTFDDGYADNLHFAKPRLAAAAIPATVFVTAGKVDSHSEFWWDALEAIFLTDARLPEVLTLTISGATRTWHLPAGAPTTGTAPRWHVLMRQQALSPRQLAYLELTQALQHLETAQREGMVAELFDWAGRDAQVRATHRVMTASELLELAQGGLVEVGAHTMTHPVLAGLSEAQQQAEIMGSKRALEAKLQRRVLSFAYPFGGRSHYSRQTPRLVRAAGFDCACSNFEGPVAFYTRRYQLPRYLVRDWDGETFAAKLEAWFGNP